MALRKVTPHSYAAMRLSSQPRTRRPALNTIRTLPG
jgi:hypothetical protein